MQRRRQAQTGDQAGGMSRRSFMTVAAGAAALAATGSRAATGAVGPESWNALRAQFLLGDGVTYMNNGSLGPCPRVVLEKAQHAWERMEENPVGEYYGPLIEEAEAVRSRAAEFLGCSPGELSITDNTTDGMNTVAQGIDLQAGDRVLTTNHEHPGGRVCWEYFARRRGVAIDEITLPVPPRNEEELVDLLKAGLTPKTRVISVSHVTFSTGLRLPIARIAELARTHGALLVVDGAQAPGGLHVDVKALGCDAYATSAHKWLLAPKGTGLLYIREGARERIDPLPLQHGPRVYTASTGTRNLPAVIGLGAAVDFLGALGVSEVEARNLDLRRELVAALAALAKGRIVSPVDGPMAAPLVTLELPADVAARNLATALADRHRVIVKVVPRGLVNGIRISTHVYNSKDDIARIASALRTELG